MEITSNPEEIDEIDRKSCSWRWRKLSLARIRDPGKARSGWSGIEREMAELGPKQAEAASMPSGRKGEGRHRLPSPASRKEIEGSGSCSGNRLAQL